LTLDEYQPDLVFVAAERCHIIRDRVWGPPDLVVEVLSAESRRYDRDQKRDWYQRYGVREEWLVDPMAKSVEVCDLQRGACAGYQDAQIVGSRVLLRLRRTPARVFD
jgi:Uma2 family endonuclease